MMKQLKNPQKPVCIWLLVLLAASIGMMLIGAATRLTDSGLSMVEWRPLMGMIPPLTIQEWERIFTLYQQIPEYQHVNFVMTLQEFKQIFFWEYVHRLWGRALGILFLLPWGYFLYKRALTRKQAVLLLLIPLLGMLQGLMGWWMVQSGFAVRVDVSPYRLLLHLLLALLIVTLLWEIYLRYRGLVTTKLRLCWNGQFCLLLCLGLTIIAGALTAGTRAGLIYNEFPYMGNGFIPSDYIPRGYSMGGELLRIVIFENPASVQLHHRLLASLSVLIGCFVTLKIGGKLALMLLGLLMLQFLLGIATLLSGLNLFLALTHQLGAVLLFLGAWLFYRQSQPNRCY